MPGLAGLVSSSAPNDVAVSLPRMADRLRHRARDATGSRLVGGCGFASVVLQGQPALAERGDFLLAAVGEIYEDEGGPAAGDGGGLAEHLLRRHEQGGVTALCGLNGIYAVALWDRRRRELTLLTDRHGFMRVYWRRHNDGLAFATQYKAILPLLGSSWSVDERAVADLLSVGYFLDGRTPVEGVEVLAPATVLRWRDRVISSETYWDYRFGGAEDERLPGAEHGERLFAAMQRAVARRTAAIPAGSRTCHLLTGGLDSRLAAGLFRQTGDHLDLVSNTIGDPRCWDVRFARRLADSLGIPHANIPVGPDYIARYAEEGVWRAEGCAPAYTCWIVAEDAFLTRERCEYVVNGFLGDSLSGQRVPPELAVEGDPEQALTRLWPRLYNVFFTEEELGKLLRPDVFARVRGESFASLRRTFLAAPSERVVDRIDYADLRQRQRRFIITHLDLMGALATVLNPFTDAELVDLWLRVPAPLRVRQRLYRRIIAEHFPALARVPSSQTGAPLGSGPLRLWAHKKGLRVRLRLLGPVSPDLLGADPRRHVRYQEWIGTGSRRFVTDVLGDAEALGDLVDPAAVARLVDDHMAGRRREPGKLSVLLSLALWRRRFA